MSRREDISNAIWDDPDFTDLTPQAKLIYLWSFTNSRCNMAGLYLIPRSLIAAETGLTERRVDVALNELEASHFVRYDGKLLWVRARVKHLRTTNALMARSVRNAVAEHGTHPFTEAFREEYPKGHWIYKTHDRKNGSDPSV